MESITTSVIVSFDYNKNTDTAVLIVGKRSSKGVVTVVNAFQGDEAKELYKLYKRLTAKKGEV